MPYLCGTFQVHIRRYLNESWFTLYFDEAKSRQNTRGETKTFDMFPNLIRKRYDLSKEEEISITR